MTKIQKVVFCPHCKKDFYAIVDINVSEFEKRNVVRR